MFFNNSLHTSFAAGGSFSFTVTLQNRKSHLLVAFCPKKHHEYRLWQRRFWEHTFKDVLDFEHHVNYIHYNPVKHGLVKNLHDWPHSSFHHYTQQW